MLSKAASYAPAFLVALGVFFLGWAAHGFFLGWNAHHPDSAPQPRPPACTTEDQPRGPCFWDAQQQGNGHGHSFYVDEQGRVYTTR